MNMREAGRNSPGHSAVDNNLSLQCIKQTHSVPGCDDECLNAFNIRIDFVWVDRHAKPIAAKKKNDFFFGLLTL